MRCHLASCDLRQLTSHRHTLDDSSLPTGELRYGAAKSVPPPTVIAERLNALHAYREAQRIGSSNASAPHVTSAPLYSMMAWAHNDEHLKLMLETDLLHPMTSSRYLGPTEALKQAGKVVSTGEAWTAVMATYTKTFGYHLPPIEGRHPADPTAVYAAITAQQVNAWLARREPSTKERWQRLILASWYDEHGQRRDLRSEVGPAANSSARYKQTRHFSSDTGRSGAQRSAYEKGIEDVMG